MKTMLLLGLLAESVLALPAAEAHIVFAYPDPFTGECLVIELPGPHVSAWIEPCGPVFHTGTWPPTPACTRHLRSFRRAP